jgi:tripartite-type tricarboxylate transporter receptor subunit TctC
MGNQAAAQRDSLAYQMTRRQSLVTAVMAPFVATFARAAGYPDRPIRIASPYAAGGVGETIMHLLAVSMEARLGEKIIVEAKPGAAGNVGTEEVARAAPDGSTLLIAATNNFVINQFVMKMTFDPLATLAPIAKIAEVPLVLFSNPAVPARAVQELIAYAKANPGKVNYGVPSLGTVNHLMMERLKQPPGQTSLVFPIVVRRRLCWRCSRTRFRFFPLGLPRLGRVSARAG